MLDVYCLTLLRALIVVRLGLCHVNRVVNIIIIINHKMTILQMDWKSSTIFSLECIFSNDKGTHSFLKIISYCVKKVRRMLVFS